MKSRPTAITTAKTRKTAPASGSISSTANAIPKEALAWSLGNDASVPLAYGCQTPAWASYGRGHSGNNLVGGLFAEGRVASERRNALVAPTSAVDVTGVKPFVIRLKEGKVERVDVELGLRDEESERVEIKNGVAKGDTLLTGAARGISPGTPVRVSSPSDVAPAKD